LCQEFLSFKREMTLYLSEESNEISSDQVLDRMVPALSNLATQNHREIVGRLDNIERRQKNLEVSSANQERLFNRISRGDLQITVRLPEEALPIAGDMILDGNSQGQAHQEPNPEQAQPSQYRMSRSLNTVSEVWDEFKRGINGNPPVEMLEHLYGAKWRRSEAERKFFERRSKVIRLVESVMEENALNDVAAIQAVDAWLLQNQKSVAWLSRNIEKFSEMFAL
jgi:hypothetical protein